MKKIAAATFLLTCACLMGGMGESGAQNTTDHQVVRGDTLWDLSGNYLTDPLLWPKIWKVNPEIANPHRIYPGQNVRIPDGMGRPAASPGDGSGSALARQMVSVDMSKGQMPLRLISKEKLDDDKGMDAVLMKVYDRGIGIVTSEIPSGGKILQTETGWKISGHMEKIAIKAPNAKVGQQFGVYRDLGKVDHPRSIQSPGHLLADIAIIEVIEADAANQYGRVVRAFAEVQSGDVLGPVPPMPVLAGTKKGVRSVSGTVVAMHMGRLVAGGDDIVYIDLGSQDGVVPGDMLHVQDSEKNADIDRESAQIMILRTTGKTAAALVTMQSDHQVVPGDKVGPVL